MQQINNRELDLISYFDNLNLSGQAFLYLKTRIPVFEIALLALDFGFQFAQKGCDLDEEEEGFLNDFIEESTNTMIERGYIKKPDIN